MKKFSVDSVTIVIGVLLVVVVAGSCRALLQDKLLTSDDYEHHAARTANYYLALKQGQLPPRWAPNLNDSFGYPTFVYSYHLPYAVATAFHALRFSIQESVNLAVIFFLSLGVIGAYLYGLYKKLSQYLAAAVAAAFIFNPYTLLNVFWRGALGEVAFYCLLPFFFLCLDVFLSEKVGTKKEKLSGVVLALTSSALALSHLISLVVLVPVAIGYVFFDVRKNKKFEQYREKLITIGVVGTVSFLLTAWYLLPAVLEKSLVQFDTSKVSSVYADQFLPLEAVFSVGRRINRSEYFLDVIQLGPLLFTVVIFGTILGYSKRILDSYSRYWVTLVKISIFLALSLSKFAWDALPVLTVLQFPWRLLWLSNVGLFMLAVMLAVSLQKPWQRALAVCLIAGSVWSVIAYAQPKGYSTRSDYEWYESVATGSSFDEFRPVGALPSYELSEKVVLIPVAAAAPLPSVDVKFWNGSMMEYVVTSSSSAQVVQKTLYFPGWEVMIDGQKVHVNSEFTEYPGLITVPVPSGTHTIVARFTGRTSIRDLGMVLTLIGTGFAAYITAMALKRS